MRWQVVVFWLGVALQLAGFALNWKRVNGVVKLLSDLDGQPQDLSGQLFPGRSQLRRIVQRQRG